MLPAKAAKYLSKHSGGYKPNVVNPTDKLFDAVCVVPALAELENAEQLLESLRKNAPDTLGKTLILFVVNNTASASEEVKANNAETIRLLVNYRSELNVEAIDASTPGNELDEKNGGVGLARKIGMDYALSKFDYESSSANFLVCLDADCTVSENYLEAIFDAFNVRGIKAGYVNFEHRLSGNDDIDRAIINYELFLRYYVLGLKYARSPYAFHTIGSTMLCDYESYVTIGGMNKRKAGEDFYFMEKLAKNFVIENVKDTTVYPSSRPSWRVPFGTGQRVKRHLSNEKNEYLVYHPDSFSVLKKWNEAFLKEGLDVKNLLKISEEISPALFYFLKSNGFEESMTKIKNNSKTEVQIEKQKIFWFDGFRTLKLIHYLRENGLADIDTFDAVREVIMREGFKLKNVDIEGITKDSSPEQQMGLLWLIKELESR